MPTTESLGAAAAAKIFGEKTKTQTLLNVLLKNYKFGLISVLVSLSYFLIISFLISNHLNSQLSLSEWYTYPFLILLVINIFYGYKY